MPPVTASALRTAQIVVLVGEALELRLHLRTRMSGAAAEWESLQTPEVLEKLESAGQKAIEKLNKKYQVTVEPLPEDTLLFRVRAYDRLESAKPRAKSAGTELEKQVLDVLADLTTRVEEIGSEATGVPIVATGQWRLGPGLSIGVGGGAEELEGRIHDLRAKRRLMGLLFAGVGLASVLLIGGGIAFLFWARYFTGVYFLLYGVFFLFGAFWARTSMTSADQDLVDLRDQQDLGELLEEPLERRAQKLFQVHSQQLRRYYEQALLQRGVIFITGLLCIFAGFGIIAAAFWLLADGNKSLSEQIVIAALGAVGGILSNFIAVVYLRMFTETVKSIGGFHDRLVLTHHLHFANFLAAKVTEKGLRDTTLAHMAESMAIIESEQPEAVGDTARADGGTPRAPNRT